MIKKLISTLCTLTAPVLFCILTSGHCQSPPPAESLVNSFRPVSEDLLPLSNRMVTVELRNTPLRDALYSIAQSSGLNLVLDKDVNPDTPLTLSIRNVSAREALDIILNAAGYFYDLQNNILYVKAFDTIIIEFGQPAIVQSYAVDVGGDILGAAVEGAGEFGGGGSGGQDMKGMIEQKVTSDEKAFDFWGSIEASLQSILNLSESSAPAAGGTGLRSGYTINRMTGTISVTAQKQKTDHIKRYLETLRATLNRQVIIEARVLEVSLSDGLKYGMDWSWLQSSSITIEGSNFSNVLSASDANVQVHISRGDFDGTVKAIASQGKVSVLSNPRVNIMNGQTALLSVGRSQSFLSSIETDVSTGDNPIITYTTDTASILSGVMIGIVPFIHANGSVSMTITPIISDLVSLDEKAIGDDGTTISLPTVDVRQLSTSVQVQNGDMVVIGGLIQTKKAKDDSRVPFVGKIPLIGYLFTQFEKKDEQTDIVILLKPTLKL
ncbi:MAG: pilus (MSHA type) biogenesis protein MshL [bacterium]|nr:pilus (MSHA type) biogenesis protein MshL [bacterium]